MSGTTVILIGVPDELLTGLPAKDQAAIRSAVGHRVSNLGYDAAGLLELEWHHDGDTHTIWVEPDWTFSANAPNTRRLRNAIYQHPEIVARMSDAEIRHALDLFGYETKEDTPALTPPA